MKREAVTVADYIMQYNIDTEWLEIFSESRGYAERYMTAKYEWEEDVYNAVVTNAYNHNGRPVLVIA